MLITGFGVRLGALAIVGTMSVAIYHALTINGFNIYLLELLVLYFGAALSLVMTGGGKFSFDYLIVKRYFNSNLDLATSTSTQVALTSPSIG